MSRQKETRRILANYECEKVTFHKIFLGKLCFLLFGPTELFDVLDVFLIYQPTQL